MKSSNCFLAILLAILSSVVLTFYLAQYLSISLLVKELKSEPYSNKVTLDLSSLNNTSAYNKELYGGFYTIKNKTISQFNIGKVNKNISFIIFQVHTHNYEITLYNNTKVYGSYITGTNVGLYSDVLKSKNVFFVANDNDVDLKMYISVHGYSVHDPIPGGENLEFPVLISPFLRVRYDKDIVHVDAQPSSDSNSLVKFYKMDTRENDFTENTYFEGIRNMITYAGIIENGKELTSTVELKIMRRSLSAYPALGRVYTAVAINEKSGVYSVYVPTFSYACSPLKRDCYPHDNPLYHIVNFSLIVAGIFICFFGHSYIKTEIFLSGLLTGAVMAYLFIFKSSDIYDPVQLGLATLMGVLIGATWLLFWFYHKKKTISLFMTALQFGLLCSAVIYYRMPNFEPLREDIFFWTMFCCFGIIIALLASMDTKLCINLTGAVLGVYALIFALDHYFGSNLKYIPINVLRRATVDDFRFVLLEPTFQWPELLLTIIWIILSFLALLWKYNTKRDDTTSTNLTTRPEIRSYGTINAPDTVVTSNSTRTSLVNEYSTLIP